MKRLLPLLLALLIVLSFSGCGASQKSADSGSAASKVAVSKPVDPWKKKYDAGVKNLAAGKYEKAAECFTDAIALKPEDSQAYIQRGDSYLKLALVAEQNEKIADLRKKAEEDFLKAADLESKNAQIYLKLADLYQAQKDHTQEKAILKRGYAATGDEKIHARMEQIAAAEKAALPNAILALKHSLGSVSPRAFLSCAGADIAPVPRTAYGFLNSYSADFDRDGNTEVAVLSVVHGSQPTFCVTIYRYDGQTLQKISSTNLLKIEYCSETAVSAFYNSKLQQYCIAVDEQYVGAYTGSTQKQVILYTLGSSLIKRNAWLWDPNMETDHDDGVDLQKMKQAGIALIVNYTQYRDADFSRNTANSFKWLGKTHITIQNPEDGWSSNKFMSITNG